MGLPSGATADLSDEMGALVSVAAGVDDAAVACGCDESCFAVHAASMAICGTRNGCSHMAWIKLKLISTFGAIRGGLHRDRREYFPREGGRSAPAGAERRLSPAAA